MPGCWFLTAMGQQTEIEQTADILCHVLSHGQTGRRLCPFLKKMGHLQFFHTVIWSQAIDATNLTTSRQVLHNPERLLR